MTQVYRARQTAQDYAVDDEPRIGVSHPTVAKAREQSTGNDLPVDETRIGLDGKVRRMPTRPARGSSAGERSPVAYVDLRRESLLTALRCVTLRLRLLQAEADQLGIFLRNDWISPDQAEESLVDLNLIDLAYPQIAESA